MEEVGILIVREQYLTESFYKSYFKKQGFKNTIKFYVTKDIKEGYKKYLEVNPSMIIENNDITKDKSTLAFSKKIRRENSTIPMICMMSIELAGLSKGKERLKDYNAVVNGDSVSGFSTLVYVIYKLSKDLGIQGIWEEREDPKYRERLEKGNIPENYWIL
jgi:hypothetical protein